METGCLYCHSPYVPRKDHPHYCDNCVKICKNCGELKVIWAFNFKPEVPSKERTKKIKKELTKDVCHSCEVGKTKKQEVEVGPSPLPLWGAESVSKSKTVDSLSEINKLLTKINSRL